MLDTHTADEIVRAYLEVIEHRIVPLTASGVAKGCKVFGAAILRKSDLSVVVACTNDEATSPLLHGEIATLFEYHRMASDRRPSPEECLFLSTHEPCSLCLSGITWSGFDNFAYMFTYQDTMETFNIPHDIRILKEVFQVGTQGGTGSDTLYNRKNAFWTAYSLQQLIDKIPAEEERSHLRARLTHVKQLYNGLSQTYQDSKQSSQADIPLA